MTKVLRRLGFSRETGAALITLSAMPRREAGLQKGGLAEQVAAAAERHPDKRIELWFESLPRT